MDNHLYLILKSARPSLTPHFDYNVRMQTEVFNRREFAARLTPVIAGLLAGCRPSNEPDRALDFVNSFPRDISPFAKSVTRTPVAGATSVLIHIRSKHAEGIPTEILTDDQLARGRTVQGEVANIVQTICERYPVSLMVIEGMIDSDVNTVRTLAASYREAVNLARESSRGLHAAESGAHQLSPERLLQARTLNSEVLAHVEKIRLEIERDSGIRGIAARAAKEGTALLGAETEATIKVVQEYHAKLLQLVSLMKEMKEILRLSPEQLARPVYSKRLAVLTSNFEKVNSEIGPQSDFYNEKVLKFREDTLLSGLPAVAPGQPLRIIVAPYGGEHNYLDNIEIWNRNNPNSKIALIVIEPKSWVSAPARSRN